MDTHPIQASPQRWIVALGVLLVAGVQGLFLWGYTCLLYTSLFVGYIKKNVLYGFKYALKWILMRCKITLEISLF